MDKTGGQAFPLSGEGFQEDGMTLRDYFAGQVLTTFDKTTNSDRSFECLARYCYQLADAMIAQREKSE